MIISVYVKTHKTTGLKYLGKTVSDPLRYSGSGLYWKRHLKEHGNLVDTEVLAVFDLETQKEDLTKFCLDFSEAYDIVNSSLWANLIVENGLDGKPVGAPGCVFSPETRDKIAVTSRERWSDPEYARKVSESQSESWTDERKKIHSESLTGKSRPEHSEYMKNIWSENKESMCNIGDLPRTDSHNKAISAALKGKKKSHSHIEAMRKSALSRKPSNTPKGATWVKKDHYEVNGISITKTKKQSVWLVDFKLKKIEIRGLRNAVDFILTNDELNNKE